MVVLWQEMTTRQEKGNPGLHSREMTNGNQGIRLNHQKGRPHHLEASLRRLTRTLPRQRALPLQGTNRLLRELRSWGRGSRKSPLEWRLLKQ